jgi:hypothetical protein
MTVVENATLLARQISLMWISIKSVRIVFTAKSLLFRPYRTLQLYYFKTILTIWLINRGTLKIFFVILWKRWYFCLKMCLFILEKFNSFKEYIWTQLTIYICSTRTILWKGERGVRPSLLKSFFLFGLFAEMWYFQHSNQYLKCNNPIA